MSEFINTIDIIGDDALTDSIIDRSITEFRDNSIVKIGINAFTNCTKLTSVNLPSVTSIEYAFDGCSSLTDVNCPMVTSIGQYTFRSCTQLASVYFPQLTNMEQGCAFQNCSALASVDFPQLTSIGGSSTFYGCTSLVNINMPLLTKLGGSTFKNCTSLNSVNFPLVAGTINGEFEGCTALTSADFSLVTNVYNATFTNCTSLTTLILRNISVVPPLYNTNVFKNTKIASGKGYIYVPAMLVDDYKVATNWSTYANQFRALEDWTVDGTVTGELDIENRRMVRFFNDDGTLLGYKVVTVGSDAVYDGTPVCSEDETWEFKGFEPSPTNVTEDMDCYAQYKPNVYTWDAVASAVADGTYKDVYAVGDVVPLDLGSEGVISMQIVAFDADNLADGSGKAPITWIAKEVLNTVKYLNPIASAHYENKEVPATNNAGSFNISSIGKASHFVNDILGGQVAEITHTFTAPSDGTVKVRYRGFTNPSVGAKIGTMEVILDGEKIVEHADNSLRSYSKEVAAGDVVTLVGRITTENVLNLSTTAFIEISFTSLVTLTVTCNNVMTQTVVGYDVGTGSVGGWEKSELRTYLKETIEPLMPEGACSSIKEVTKTHIALDTSGTQFTQSTMEDIWIPDYNEIFGSTSPYNSIYNSAVNRKKVKANGGYINGWWLRSTTDNVEYWEYVSSSGSKGSGYLGTSYGVALGFCT